MNTYTKKELIMQLIATLTAMLNEEGQSKIVSAEIEKEEKVEFLTIKQATEVASGISEHTIRQLVMQNKVNYIRTGQGKRGKILINKASLLAYCNNNNDLP